MSPSFVVCLQRQGEPPLAEVLAALAEVCGATWQVTFGEEWGNPRDGRGQAIQGQVSFGEITVSVGLGTRWLDGGGGDSASATLDFTVGGTAPWRAQAQLWDALAARLLPLGYVNRSLDTVSTQALLDHVRALEPDRARELTERAGAQTLARLAGETPDDYGTLALSYRPYVPIGQALACVRHPEKITGLSISGCALGLLPDAVARFVHLETLDAGNNELTTLSPVLFELRKLRSLTLDGNQLGELPPALAGLPLAHLSLDRNGLGAIPAPVFELTGLTHLMFSRNQLVELPVELSRLRRLERLAVERNRLSAIAPAAISGLDALQFLSLERNELTALPPELFALPHLQEIMVGHNLLTALPAEIGSAPALVRVRVTGNPIDERVVAGWKTAYPRCHVQTEPSELEKLGWDG